MATITLVQGDTLPVIELVLDTRGVGGAPDKPFDITSGTVYVDALLVVPSTEEIVETIVGVPYTVEGKTNEVRMSLAGGVLDVPTGEYQLWALVTDRSFTPPRTQHIKGRPPQRVRVIGGPS